MKSVLHHLHLRKRGAHTTEPFPSKKFGIRMLDHMAIAAGIIGPVMALPQIYKIYFLHNAAGVSVLSWMAFGILNIPFILYGFVHRDRLILTTYILWCAVNLTVAFGAILYGL